MHAMLDERPDGAVTLVIHAHSRPGVLAKIATTFYRRGMNIGALTAEPSSEPEMARIIVRVAAPRPALERVALAIDNLVDVLSVELI